MNEPKSAGMPVGRNITVQGSNTNELIFESNSLASLVSESSLSKSSSKLSGSQGDFNHLTVREE